MEGSRARGAWRRLLSVPGYALAWLLWIGAAPVWLVVAAIVDASRGRRAVALRSGAFVAWYLSCVMLGVAVSAAISRGRLGGEPLDLVRPRS